MVRPVSHPNWTDVGIFWATLGGVVVTLLAVLVALFGHRVQERRKRPRLSLSVDPVSMGVEIHSGDAEILSLRIHNEKGRDTAREVEVFVTVFGQDGDIFLMAGEEVALNWDDPLGDGGGRSTATVPAGSSRRVSFAVLQHLAAVDEQGRADWAYLAVYPPNKVTHATLREGVPYAVTISVTGANFDALSYRGAVAFEEHDEPVGDVFVRIKSLGWVSQPEPVDEWDGSTSVFTRAMGRLPEQGPTR
jgi:hypothetical protein